MKVETAGTQDNEALTQLMEEKPVPKNRNRSGNGDKN